MTTGNWHPRNGVMVPCVVPTDKGLCALGGEHFQDMTREEAQERYDAMGVERAQMLAFARSRNGDI